jgi:hypothetical protein
MDLDAIPVGLHDYEVWLLIKDQKMFHFTNLIYDRVRREGVYYAIAENCPLG